MIGCFFYMVSRLDFWVEVKAVFVFTFIVVQLFNNGDILVSDRVARILVLFIIRIGAKKAISHSAFFSQL